MTLSEWIKEYCEENNIELPDDIPDENTALRFLALNGNGCNGSDFEIVEVKFVRGAASGIINIVVPNVEYWDDLNVHVAQGDINLLPAMNEKTVQVILYKGNANCYSTWSLSGDNYNADNELITGAGTITVE